MFGFFFGQASYERNRSEDVSIQELLGLQRWSRHRLGDCTLPCTDDQGQRECADLPVGLSRLLHMLGVRYDCSICLSAAKALEVEPPPGVTSSTNSIL